MTEYTPLMVFLETKKIFEAAQLPGESTDDTIRRFLKVPPMTRKASGRRKNEWSERYALEWLRKVGYKNIIHHWNKTPDFIADGQPFDAKRLLGKTVKRIKFTYKQRANLIEMNATVLVFEKGSKTPLIIKAHDLQGQSYQGIRFVD